MADTTTIPTIPLTTNPSWSGSPDQSAFNMSTLTDAIRKQIQTQNPNALSGNSDLPSWGLDVLFHGKKDAPSWLNSIIQNNITPNLSQYLTNQPPSSQSQMRDMLDKLITTPPDYSGLNQDFSKGVLDLQEKLASSSPSSADILKGVESSADQQFKEYLKQVNAPSSVDEAMKAIDTQTLQQTLADIDKLVAGNVADVKMGAQERGIGGAGQTSDIEQNAIAQVLGQGTESKAKAYTTLASQELQRQKSKEDQVIKAYGDRFAMEPQLQTVAQGWYNLDQNYQKMVLDTANKTADRLLAQFTDLSKIQSSDRQNLIDQLMKEMLQDQQIGFDKEKLQAQIDQWNASNQIARDELSVKARNQLDQLESQPSFWEGVAGNAISGLTGGIAGGIAGGIGTVIASSAKPSGSSAEITD